MEVGDHGVVCGAVVDPDDVEVIVFGEAAQDGEDAVDLSGGGRHVGLLTLGGGQGGGVRIEGERDVLARSGPVQ